MGTLNYVMHGLSNVNHGLDVLKLAYDIISLLLSTAAFVFNVLFRTARKFSPGTGLAPGYYQNFLVPALTATDGEVVAEGAWGTRDLNSQYLNLF